MISHSYILTITPVSTGDDGIRALRALLKLALRRFGLRCTSITTMENAGAIGPTPALCSKSFGPPTLEN
jgi:hypothetical protein